MTQMRDAYKDHKHTEMQSEGCKECVLIRKAAGDACSFHLLRKSKRDGSLTGENRLG